MNQAAQRKSSRFSSTPRKPYAPANRTAGLSPAETITNAIIARLEAGTVPWRQPWTGRARSLPRRACGTPYRGTNIFWLWLMAETHHYASDTWMTYRQAAELGGQVRRGERSTIAVFYKSYGQAVPDATTGGDTIEARRVLKSYAVFNVDQIDGLPDRYATPSPAAASPHDPDRRTAIDAFFAAIPSTVVYGGDDACFVPSRDIIKMPAAERFIDTDHFAGTLAHEHIHWTGAAPRLDRAFGKRFGDAAYAAEEIVAELGSAIVGAAIDIPVTHLDDHASYLAHWLKILKADPRAILTFAAKADEAASYLLAFAGLDPAIDDTDAAADAPDTGLPEGENPLSD